MDNTGTNKKNKKKILSGYSAFEKRDFLFAYLLVLFPLAQFAIFWFYTNVSSFVLAFQDAGGNFTFDNFATVWNAFVDKDSFGFNLFDSLKRTWLTWSLGALICFPCSLISVYVLTCKIRFHYFYRVCYILPGLIGSVIWTMFMRMLVQANGPVIAICEALGITLPGNAARHGLLGVAETAFPTLMVIQVLLGIVGDSPVITGAFARVSDELYESADLDGAGFWVKCFKIAIPCIWPTISTLLVFKLCSIFTCDCNVFLYSLGDGQPDMSTIGFQLFYLTERIAASGAGRSAYGYPAALGMILTALTLPICLGGRRVLDKITDSVEN